jgi:hypothetical protein
VVARSADGNALEHVAAEIDALAGSFAPAAGPIVADALERRIDALMRSRAEWVDGLDADARSALRHSAGRTIQDAASEVVRRLSDRDLWRSPLVAPGLREPSSVGWDAALPEWLAAILRRVVGRPSAAPEPGDLDDPSNRVWIVLLASAAPLDPLLEEFGLAPSTVPDLGGGHFGLLPRSTAQLDPSGTLIALWKRYRLAYRRYAALEARRRPRRV